MSTQQFKDSQTIFWRILSWIYYAKRPLKMGELREAIITRDEEEGFEETDLMDPDEIVEACGSLVTHEREADNIKFSHEKVQEFIKERHTSDLLPELDVVNTCIDILLLDDYNIGAAEDKASFESRVQEHPFMLYAAGYWGEHLKSANAEGDEGVRKKLVLLSCCPAKIDSLSQAQKFNAGTAWETVQTRWKRGASLLHLFAENGLLAMAQLILTQPKLFLVISQIALLIYRKEMKLL